VDTSFSMLVNWGRYAELFGYNAAREELYVDRGV
jgi:NitT/TauT family transport system ATP-binding protein